MGKVQRVNDNIYRKVATGADYIRPSGVLRDTLIKITALQATNRYVNTGFIFAVGTNELEVYVNGVLKRANAYVGEFLQGDYSETGSTEIRFNTTVIAENDLIRFRVTTAYYRETYTNQVEDYTGASKILRTTITSGEWLVSGNDVYYSIDISTSIMNNNCTVYCVDASSLEKVSPLDVKHIDNTEIQVWMPDNTVELLISVTG